MGSGQWTRNTMAPKGKMWWADGRLYQGDFCDGRKHGEGELGWPDGRSYNGQWCEGKQHGTAIACTARGFKRNSRWGNGKFVEWLGGVLEGEQSGATGNEGAPALGGQETGGLAT